MASAGPDDLAEAWALGAPAGDWAWITGRARGRGDYYPAFLLDAASGRSIALGAVGVGENLRARFADDGRRAVWARTVSPRDRRAELWTADLTRPDSPPRALGIFLPGDPAALELSASGQRLAMVGDGRVAVYEVSSGNALAYARARLTSTRGQRKCLAVFSTDWVSSWTATTSHTAMRRPVRYASRPDRDWRNEIPGNSISRLFSMTYRATRRFLDVRAARACSASSRSNRAGTVPETFTLLTF